MASLSPNQGAPSAALLAAIVDSSEDAILSKDLNGCITSWNRSAERLFGYSAAEAIGQSVKMLFPPDRHDEESSILESIRRGQRIEPYETIRLTKSGSLVDVSVTVSPILDPERGIIGASKIARDIRAQKRSEEQFRMTLASIGDAVIATDREGRITFMNAIAESLTGWSTAEAISKPLDEVFEIESEISRAKVESPVSKVIRDRRVVGLANHTRLLSRDGLGRPIDDTAAPIFSPSGEFLGVVLVFRDVADRQAAQLAAIRLAAIVEGSHDAIVGKNLQGIVTSWNSAAEQTFGYTAAEIVGRPISILFPADRLDEEPRILARLQRGERVDHFETVRVRKDGTAINVSLAISPIRDQSGRIIGASKIARDITAQKAAERQLREAQSQLADHAARLEERVRERTAELERMAGEAQAFSYSLSHDIRAPLRAIQGFADIVITDYGAQIPEGVEHLQRVVRAAERMDRLLSDVLSYSQIAQKEIVSEPIDLAPLLKDLVSERPELQAPAVALTIVEPLDRVLGNIASLTQALSNLLENAVKYVPPNVRPEVKVFTTVEDGNVRIYVQDNGIGVKPEDQRRLFSAFQRLHTRDAYEGTGLGLAIVRRAAERMGGTAGLSSTPGVGSLFWIELRGA